MPKFSERSLNRLRECDKRLQDLFMEVISVYDCTILCGHRIKEDQNKAYSEGKSQLEWPKSKHNKNPSLAVDVAPYVNDKVSFDKLDCCYFAGKVMAIADYYGGIKVRWGGDWGGNDCVSDEHFQDLIHFELVGE